MRALLLALLILPLGSAQTSSGRIAGTVTDASGAPVPNASVSMRQVATNTSKKIKTSSSGVYDEPLLLPGTYEITVEAPGLAPQIARGIRLEVSPPATGHFQLPTASVA